MLPEWLLEVPPGAVQGGTHSSPPARGAGSTSWPPTSTLAACPPWPLTSARPGKRRRSRDWLSALLQQPARCAAKALAAGPGRACCLQEVWAPHLVDRVCVPQPWWPRRDQLALHGGQRPGGMRCGRWDRNASELICSRSAHCRSPSACLPQVQVALLLLQRRQLPCSCWTAMTGWSGTPGTACPPTAGWVSGAKPAE